MAEKRKKELRLIYEQIFQQSAGKVYNFVLSISRGNTYLAEEVTQTVFERLWQNIENLQNVRNMTAYLFTTAKNEMFNLRRHETVEWIYKNYLIEHNIDADLTTDKEVDLNFMIQYIRELTVGLPPMQKKVFEMGKLQQYSVRDIAQELNIAESTVETHLQRALRTIREELRGRYGIDKILCIAMLVLNIFGNL